MEEENSDQFSSDSNVSVLLGFTPVSTVYILVDLDVVVVDFQLLLLRQRYIVDPPVVPLFCARTPDPKIQSKIQICFGVQCSALNTSSTG